MATAAYKYRHRVLSTSLFAHLKSNYSTIAARLGRTRQIASYVPSAASLGAPQGGLSIDPSQYPQVHRGSTVDVLHDVQIADPYRWLENPDSDETKDFVTAQNQLTQGVLAQCDTREKFRALMTALYDYPKFGTPFKRGKRYYYYHNSGLQQHYVLYSQPALGAEPTVFFDPNKLSEDGTVALGSMAWSDDGSLVAYTLSSGGSDWTKIHVMSVPEDGVSPPLPLPDVLEYVKFSSLDWTLDNRGFFYNRYLPAAKLGGVDLGTETDSNTNQLLCYHVLGTPQSEDVTVWAMPEEPTWMSSAGVTEDGKYLLLYISQGCLPANKVYVVDVAALSRTPEGHVDWAADDFHKGSKLPVVKLVDDFSASFSVVANDGPLFFIKTNLDAPRYRLVKTDVTSPSPPSTWADVIPHHPADVLKGIAPVAGDKLVVRYTRDVVSVLQLHDLHSGQLLQTFALPAVGKVDSISCERKDREFFFSFVSFTEPGAQYRVEMDSGERMPTLFRRTELKVAHEPADYEVRQVFVPSKDGTKVPMFITHPKGLPLDGSAPCLLYGYGGFNIALEPGFSASRLAFMRGYRGVFAQASLRGGGEYGTSWRDAGSKQNKQNVFDDFQACAAFLHAEGYCSPATTTIQGGSNGGLLVAACANQRPDLYACVIGQVGVMDMLRFHKFTIGHAWCTDYGSPDIAEDFKHILPYSPLHNVALPAGGTRQYPAVLLTTGDHDDRVVPLHSHKLIATLQYQLIHSPAARAAGAPQRNPLVTRVEVRAGHGAGKPTAMVIAESADVWGFAAKCMGATWHDDSLDTAAATPAEPAVPAKPVAAAAAAQ